MLCFSVSIHGQTFEIVYAWRTFNRILTHHFAVLSLIFTINKQSNITSSYQCVERSATISDKQKLTFSWQKRSFICKSYHLVNSMAKGTRAHNYAELDRLFSSIEKLASNFSMSQTIRD